MKVSCGAFSYHYLVKPIGPWDVGKIVNPPDKVLIFIEEGIGGHGNRGEDDVERRRKVNMKHVGKARQVVASKDITKLIPICHLPEANWLVGTTSPSTRVIDLCCVAILL